MENKSVFHRMKYFQFSFDEYENVMQTFFYFMEN